jgi:hypothetical protein
MATLNVTSSGHATLTASTVDTVNLSIASSMVVLTNRGSADIYYQWAGRDHVYRRRDEPDDWRVLRQATSRRLDRG